MTVAEVQVVTAKMPNGATCVYRPSDHAYFKSYNPVKGTCSGRIAGCSTVAKNNGNPSVDGLLNWAVRLANEGKDWKEEQNAKGEIGQGAHDVLEALATGHEIECKTLQDRAVRAWWNSHNFITHGTEQIVYSETHNFAGRYDAFLEDTDTEKFGLWDLKTSTYVKPEHLIQLNLYELARREVGFTPADELWILHITRDGSYQEIPVPIQPEWALCSLAIYTAGKEIRSHISAARKTAEIVGAGT